MDFLTCVTPPQFVEREFVSYVIHEADRNKQFNWLIEYYEGTLRAILPEIFGEDYEDEYPGLKYFVYGIIYTESRGHPYAIRYEPSFYSWLVNRIKDRSVRSNKGLISRRTEFESRSTSYGPMQVMGQTARELGYTDIYLTGLCDPYNGLYWGLKYLKSRMDKYGPPWEGDSLSAYNAGTPTTSNAGYVVKVMDAAGTAEVALNTLLNPEI